MGLLTSVNNIQYELERQKELRIKEQKENRILKHKKEDLKALQNELETFLKTEFERYFNIAGTSYMFEFYSKERKAELLSLFFDTIKRYDEKLDVDYIPFKRELTDHFYKKYDTILKRCYKEQEQEEIYQITIQGKEIEAEELIKQKEEEEDNEILETFKTIGLILLGIICFPLLFVLSIIFGAMKGTK